MMTEDTKDTKHRKLFSLHAGQVYSSKTVVHVQDIVATPRHLRMTVEMDHGERAGVRYPLSANKATKSFEPMDI